MTNDIDQGIAKAVHEALQRHVPNLIIGVPGMEENGVSVVNIQRARRGIYTATLEMTLTGIDPESVLIDRERIEPLIASSIGRFLGYDLLLLRPAGHTLEYDDDGRFQGISDQYQMTYRRM